MATVPLATGARDRRQAQVVRRFKHDPALDGSLFQKCFEQRVGPGRGRDDNVTNLGVAFFCDCSSCEGMAFRRAGIPHGRTHALRHTLACRLVNSGSPIKEVADVLRHRSLNTSLIYT